MKTDPVPVVHVITRMVQGGAQENTFQTVLRANRERFAPLLAAGPPLGPEGSMEERVAEAGIPIHRVPGLRREPAPWSDLRALRHLTRLFRERRPGIVHTHTSKAGMLGRIAAYRAGVPVVVHTSHGNVFTGYFGRLRTRFFIGLERHAARVTDALIELTPGGAAEHLAAGIGAPAQFRVIPSGIDLRPFQEACARRAAMRAELGVPEDAFLVGGAGRLEPVKGFTYFVEAALLAARTRPEAVFVLAGQGSQAALLREKAAPLGDRFRFLGHWTLMPDLMAALDLFAAPSLNEGMGRVLIEAAAAGVPAAASRIGGIPDIVEDGRTGLLVPPGDAAALAAAIAGLAQAPALRREMGAAARAKAGPEFSVETMVARIEALYEELLYAKRTKPCR